jgi:hypothetical protein
MAKLTLSVIQFIVLFVLVVVTARVGHRAVNSPASHSMTAASLPASETSSVMILKPLRRYSVLNTAQDLLGFHLLELLR